MASFNERRYKRCILHLVTAKITIVLVLIIIFFFLGASAGIGAMYVFKAPKNELLFAGIGAGIGAFIGLILGINSTWKIEMQIQEAYWRIEMLDEIKKQSLSNRNAPIAKTVVAIENKLSDPKDVYKVITK